MPFKHVHDLTNGTHNEVAQEYLTLFLKQHGEGLDSWERESLELSVELIQEVYRPPTPKETPLAVFISNGDNRTLVDATTGDRICTAVNAAQAQRLMLVLNGSEVR